MQSADVDVTNDNNNTLTSPNHKESTRPRITMIPESFTSSDAEDDVKLEDSLDPSGAATNETLRAWFQRFTQMQSEIQKKLAQQSETMVPLPPPPSGTLPQRSPQPPTIAAPRVVKYQDLPYMGEMTLDNSKPRRGRKPKKADICHLIYKNYGTIFPGTPNSKNLIDRPNDHHRKPLVSDPPPKPLQHGSNELVDGLHRSDVQHRIISSLLEKRLTQESRRIQQQTTTPNVANSATSVSACKKSKNSHGAIEPEPLNLCIRDLDHLKIRLNMRTNRSLSSTKPEVVKPIGLEVKDEPVEDDDDDVEFVHETPSPASSTTYEFKFPQELLGAATGVSGATSGTLLPQDIIKTPENGVPPGGYVYWPNAGVFIHPMALQQQLLYYQKMTAAGDEGSGSGTPPLMELPPLRKLVPKPAKTSKSSSTKSETSEDESVAEGKTKRNTNFDKSPAKRKRSAIFIPPIPTENQSNPATEVSICKFKFTGGAKPSLQEKKMLSVDSGGNFRYYSGTGDKSMRGYEFFPRETLQQQAHHTQGSSTGAFLQASGERIYPSSPVDFTSKVNEFMLTPEIAPSSPQGPPSMATTTTSELMHRNNNKKRKSRKSLQREKLEQTFKEKGFLIQTQQLESAEGATYCKFRQLRKFTRYLFRSWKDYLPGNVGDNHDGAPGGRQPPEVEEMNEVLDEQEASSADHESASNMSSPRMRDNPSPSTI